MPPFAALLTAAALAAEPAAPGEAAVHAFLSRQAEAVHARFLGGATTLADWQSQRDRLRREYLEMLGLWPLPEKTPLKAAVTGTLEHEGVAIEKVHYQSRPGLYVTGNLYRPRSPRGRLPAVLYVCGHSNKGRDGNKTAYQDHGLWFARNGYVCLIVDTLQLGEVAGKHHGTYNLGRFWWQARGYTPAGVECWNGVRGLDYLVSRPDVDPERLGVTGLSGGGAATVWIASADERVRCAVPVSGMSDLLFYVNGRGANGHCDCMFPINTYAWEWTTLLALVAPRPVLFADSDADPIFPLDGHRRISERLRTVYKLFGKPDLFDDHVSPGGHAYRPDLRVAVFKWMNKHLNPAAGPVEDTQFTPLPGEKLRVFPTDADLPADAVNASIDETFVPVASVAPPAEGQFAAWRDGLVKQLRGRSFRSLPERVPAAAPAGDAVGQVQPMTSEQGIAFHLVPVVPGDGTARTGTLLVLNPDDELLEATREWARPYVEDGIVLAVLPRGGPPGRWVRKNPPNYVERAHALLGRTVDDGRVRDVVSAARYAASGFGGKVRWRLVGRGQASVLAAYAGVFEPSVAEVIAVEPPASHREGPYFLNVLRVLDVPEAFGLLAPRPLTLVNAPAEAFGRTAEVYRRAGAADKLTRK
jgi:dienelactone hydrolase